jgi:hypothetical protein
MKPSKSWAILILIVSALLLSGARNITAEGPSQPNQSTQTQTPANEHSSVPGPSVSSVHQPTAVATAKPSATYIYNQYKQTSPWGDVPTWLEAIATILLVIFAGRQMGSVKEAANAARDNADAAKDAVVSTKRYVEMTAQMVEATKQSARATELALNAERPYVFIEKQNPAMYLRITSLMREGPPINVAREPLKYKGADESDTADISLTFELRNRGKGVAVVKTVLARMLLGAGLFENENLALRTIGRSDGIVRGGISVIGSGESAECSVIGLSLPLDMVAQIIDLKISLYFAIVVRYGDVYGRNFTPGFRFEYRAPAPIPNSSATLGPYLLRARKIRRHR